MSVVLKDKKLLRNEEKFDLQKNYWLSKLAGDLPNPGLLNHSERNKVNISIREKFTIDIKGKVYDSLMKIGKSSDLAIYIILLTNLKVMLYRYKEQEDSIVVSPVYTPMNKHIKNDDYVAVRNDIHGEMTFKECIKKTKESTVEAYKNQECSFDEIIKALDDYDENDSWNKFNVICLLENIHVMKPEMDTEDNIIFSFDNIDEGLTLNVRYNRNHYDENFIEGFSMKFISILEQALNDVNGAVRNLNIVLPNERKQLLVDFNDNKVEYSMDRSIHVMFEDIVEENSENIAVIYKEQRITYSMLNNKANQVANILIKKGVKKGDFVAVLMENSIELVISMLSIMKIGAAFVPMDVTWPDERIKSILGDIDSKIALVNTNSKYNNKSFAVEVFEIESSRLIEESSNMDVKVTAEDLIYVIYTSGSTGKPKGVTIPHKGIINRFQWMNDYFGVESAKSVLKTTNHVYDSSVWQIFWPLINGGKSIIPSGDANFDADYLMEIIEKYRITIIDFVPSVFNVISQQLLEDEAVQDKLKSIKNIVIGGEEITPSIVYKFQELCPAIKITNLYGPTEASIGCVYHQVTGEEGDRIPIGKPLSNVKLLILDEDKKVVPVGVVGELYISGICLGYGYLNDKEKTDKVFIDNQFQEIDYPKVYKTGDLAYFADNGDVYFCGRSDHQVKIRGLRIELGEIENHLIKIKEIRDVVVNACCNKDNENDKFLCAYVVSDSLVDEEKIRNSIRAELPEYMIPKVIVQLNEIPLAASGKVDRKSLPIPEMKTIREDVCSEPENEIEKKMQEVWMKMLGISKIGIDSDFFELGGDSLKALTLVYMIQKEFNVKIALKQFFSSPTIRMISKYIDMGESKVYDSIVKCQKKNYYLASAAQKRLFILQQMEAGQTSYNMIATNIIEGNLNRDKLEHVFNKIAERHEALRTSFEFKDNDVIQLIHEKIKININYLDLELEGVKGNEEYINKVVDEFIRPFDLNIAPLFRVNLMKITENKHILFYDIHHIVADGISMQIIIKEFMSLYLKKELPELRIQYKDYSEWENNLLKLDTLKDQEEFWVDRLSDEIPVLNMPSDYSRPSVQSFRGKNIRFEIEESLTEGINATMKKTGSTMFMVLLSGIHILLSKYSGDEDILIGTPVAGRSHADVQNVIGLFLNTIVMRNSSDGDKTYDDFLSEVKENALRAYENQNYQFQDLVDKLELRRDISRNPLFDVMFVMQKIEDINLRIGDLMFKQYEQEFGISKFDMSFSAFELNNKIYIDLFYCTDLFKEETVQRMIGHFKNILSVITRNSKVKISEINMTSKEEERYLIHELNNSFAEYPKEKNIHQLFEEQVNKTPNNIAVDFEGNKLTYKELNSKANQLASVLRGKGIKQNSIVGMMIKESESMIIGILGILKAGGAYLPINPEYPEEKVLSLLDDSKVDVLLSDIEAINKHSSIKIQGLNIKSTVITVTDKRPQITDFDSIPFPDRSLVNYEEYHKYIGQATVKNSIAIQATRGCPYSCAYCHKIWPKGHVVRSAENIFKEIELFYKMGIRRFVFIDDIFNLHQENSRKIFEMIINHNMDIQIFFPNGVRGDILTREYIDLMIEAGVVGIAIALESASIRLQKLIKKNLDLSKLKRNIEYIAEKYPHVILELFTMHGFPTETKEEARMTIEFIKSIRWLHFPYFHILKIYKGTDMANIALENGISEESIENSVDLPFHYLPETLPFSKDFTKELQTEFLQEYFLSKERMMAVLPYQMRVLTEDEMVQKYNSYLSTEINSFSDLLDLVGISREELSEYDFIDKDYGKVPNLNNRLKKCFPKPEPKKNATKVLLLDLSQFFSTESNSMLYDVVEPPLGLMYLMSYLNKEHGNNINGKLSKSRIDFDSYDELRELLEDFKPDVIGIRTLTYYRDFYHKVVSLMRQWGIEVPIIAGGPYATSDYMNILEDRNVDLVSLGEGEITFNEIIKKIIENNNKLPDVEVLKNIKGIAFLDNNQIKTGNHREILWLDQPLGIHEDENTGNLDNVNSPDDLAYIIYTSGTTNNSKGVMIEHRNVVRLMINERMQFDFSEKDVWTMFHSYCFDFSVWEMYGALLYGGKLVLISRENAADTEKYLEVLKKEKVTVLNQIPTPFYSLMNKELKISSNDLKLRYVIFGGEALKLEMLEEWVRKYPEVKLVNMYGITETTVHVTYKEIKIEDIKSKISNIGRPIPTLSSYVMDKYLNIQPVGVPGELCVGGAGVSRGYLNNEILTKDKFVMNPYVEGERIYRSGDLVKMLSNGEMEYLGRVDLQVKIRGYRIEPGEIERELLNHKEIKQSIVVAKKDKEGTDYLCAYVVCSRALNLEELREQISRRLPRYMIPSYFVQLDKIPFTSIGKVNSKALPEPDGIAVTLDLFEEASTTIEKKLVLMWKEILSIDQIGINDDFFEIGGHSLKVAILVAKIHKEFDVNVPIFEVFNNPTIKKIAKHIASTEKSRYVSVPKAEDKEYYNLSPAQSRLFFLQEMNKKAIEYNIPINVLLEGPVDINRLNIKLNALIKRHESLRTSFVVVDNTPVQKILDDVEFGIGYYELSGEEIEATLRSLIKPFNLKEAPLFRVNIIKIENERHILMIDIHHIIFDAQSVNILLNDFIKLYNDDKLEGKLLEYKDYSEWKNNLMNSNEIKRQENYWMNLFNDEIPLLNIPTDYPREKAVNRYQGKSVSINIDDQLCNDIYDYIEQSQTTMYVFLLSVYNIALSKFSLQEDIIVGSPIEGRRHEEFNNIIGMFVNMLAMRNKPLKEKTYGDFLKSVKENVVNSLDNQDYQFEEIVKKLKIQRVIGRNPLFDVVLSYEKADFREIELKDGTKISGFDFETQTIPFDMILKVVEGEKSLNIKLIYSKGLFHRETAEFFSEQFTEVLRQIIGDNNIKIKDIEFKYEANQNGNLIKEDTGDFNF